MIKKIIPRLILFETIALIFLINGIQRLYVSSVGEKYDAIIANDFDKYYSLTSKQIGSFLNERAYWTLGAFLVLIIIIGILNKKLKIHFINSSVVFLIIFVLFPTGFFVEGLVNNYLNCFSGIFGDSYGFSFLIGGMILTVIGIAIILITLKNNINTVPNNV